MSDNHKKRRQPTPAGTRTGDGGGIPTGHDPVVPWASQSLEGYTWHPLVEAGQRIDGHIEPLGATIIDYVRVRNQISAAEACNQLQDFFLEGYLQATGPGDIPLTIAFWRYARIGPDGDAVNYHTGQHLPWFRTRASTVLGLLPPPPEWLVQSPGDPPPTSRKPAEKRASHAELYTRVMTLFQEHPKKKPPIRGSVIPTVRDELGATERQTRAVIKEVRHELAKEASQKPSQET